MITPAAALRAQLDEIDESMAALELQMTALRAQKERVLKDLGRITYPVLTLPYEITVEIFLHFVSVMRQKSDRRPQPYYGLLKLASICQTWRAVTLSTCALWNDIVILDFDGVRDAGELLKFFLPHAGSLPLDLKIGLLRDESSMDTVISTLGLYSSQWRRVDLSESSFTNSNLIFPIDRFPSSLPSLESLTLHDFEVNSNSVSSLHHAPQLRELGLGSSSWAIQLVFPFFNKLTKLVLDHYSDADLLAVLPHALNLECLQLGSSAENTQFAPLSILLPRLHTFICGDDASILHYLTLPVLERLQLQDYLSNEGVHAIRSCVAQSCSTIRTLNMIQLAFDPAYDCLCSLPTIRHLCLSWLLCMDDEEDSFVAAMISGSCLPNLESLTWDGCSAYSARQLFTMISARWQGVEGTTKLSTVSLRFAGASWDDADSMHECKDAFDQLYELGRQGPKLEITGTPNFNI
ncbi:hypothetical protein GGX14DRAFT_698921 [Mycena pura]|uniref:F-box domain-containing protein n=1 Tax=Mycena pura TaxID=153505 RepID=A0AAD6V9V8_9AGAR|nr:hypothetical protein GGX14DRAFT_698921 [Mycena pura]